VSGDAKAPLEKAMKPAARPAVRLKARRIW
jgi:hypothetical protein